MADKSKVVLIGSGSAAALLQAMFTSTPRSVFYSICRRWGEKRVFWWSVQYVCMDLLGQVYEAVQISCILLICGEGAGIEGDWVSFL